MLVRLYQRPWRERYGAEFEAHLDTGPGRLRASANVIWSALHEHVIPTPGLAATQYSVVAIVRQPSAYIPLAMSLIALASVLGHVAIYGIVHELDEGAVAHIWQLLMAGHLPGVLYFAVRWLPRATRQTLLVLAMLAAAWLANLAAVFFLT
jgi:hypothetical protein